MRHPHVPGARRHPVGPPGVFLGALIDLTEGVEEAGLEQAGEFRAFLIGESRISAVGRRMLQVDFLVGDVQVAAQDDGLLLLQIFQ
jgi:hypothetical protein